MIMGDLNARIGDQKLGKVVGTNGKPTVNSNGKKLTAFCCLNRFRMRNSFSKNKDIHKFTWPQDGKINRA
jgi:hypothetical protein